MAQLDIVETGIVGLDEILYGGIPRGNVILVGGCDRHRQNDAGCEFVYRVCFRGFFEGVSLITPPADPEPQATGMDRSAHRQSKTWRWLSPELNYAPSAT